MNHPHNSHPNWRATTCVVWRFDFALTMHSILVALLSVLHPSAVESVSPYCCRKLVTQLCCTVPITGTFLSRAPQLSLMKWFDIPVPRTRLSHISLGSKKFKYGVCPFCQKYIPICLFEPRSVPAMPQMTRREVINVENSVCLVTGHVISRILFAWSRYF